MAKIKLLNTFISSTSLTLYIYFRACDNNDIYMKRFLQIMREYMKKMVIILQQIFLYFKVYHMRLLPAKFEGES